MTGGLLPRKSQKLSLYAGGEGFDLAVADARSADAERGVVAPLARFVRLLNGVHEVASPSRRQGFLRAHPAGVARRISDRQRAS